MGVTEDNFKNPEFTRLIVLKNKKSVIKRLEK